MVEDLNKYIKDVCDGSIFITEDITEDIKVGDIVRLKVGSRFDNGMDNNPIYTDGVVNSYIPLNGFKIYVDWGNFRTNCYRQEDLELIS